MQVNKLHLNCGTEGGYPGGIQRVKLYAMKINFISYLTQCFLTRDFIPHTQIDASSFGLQKTAVGNLYFSLLFDYS